MPGCQREAFDEVSVPSSESLVPVTASWLERHRHASLPNQGPWSPLRIPWNRLVRGCQPLHSVNPSCSKVTYLKFSQTTEGGGKGGAGGEQS